MKIRVGFGFDVHQLKEGSDFWLGGVKISHHKGAVGHSDADVLIHAICDALLGAANLRDIGFHFPNTDKEYKGIDSKVLLTRVTSLIREKGFEIGNVDATICLESPKINPYVAQMEQILVKTMDLEDGDVSIKATTSEQMGYVGKEEGVNAFAVVLIQKQ